jgi:RNA polymerase sigma-70 factor, ECF subfamily
MPASHMSQVDEAAFRTLAEQHRHELLVHCYRMLGSFDDAEDMLQETLLRAWRGLHTLQHQAALRTWLYRIATNMCLDAIAGRRRRGLPNLTLPPGDPDEALPGPTSESEWIGPAPDAILDKNPAANPEAQYDAHESVSLAFLAVLQTLSGRQRAVLILRDVLGFSAGEVADLLDTSPAAVNSALQRARLSIKDYQLPQRSTEFEGDRVATLLARYVEAWHAADAASLVALLREDAVFSMPPLPLWYRGREASRQFLETYLFSGDAAGRFRLVPTAANGCPAFATYNLEADGTYRRGAIQVLTIADGQIAVIDDFLAFDDRLFHLFGLPPAL